MLLLETAGFFSEKQKNVTSTLSGALHFQNNFFLKRDTFSQYLHNIYNIYIYGASLSRSTFAIDQLVIKGALQEFVLVDQLLLKVATYA